MKAILFKPPLIQAIINGNKTQTRRLVSDDPEKKCRYKAGDRVYVKESWKLNENPDSPNYGKIEYRLDYAESHATTLVKWQNPMFMPEKSARIFLEIIDVQPQSLHDITEEDAVAEGVELYERGVKWLDYIAQHYNTTQFIFNKTNARNSFASLWDLINQNKLMKGWRDNPRVWKITFKKIDNPNG